MHTRCAVSRLLVVCRLFGIDRCRRFDAHKHHQQHDAALCRTCNAWASHGTSSGCCTGRYPDRRAHRWLGSQSLRPALGAWSGCRIGVCRRSCGRSGSDATNRIHTRKRATPDMSRDGAIVAWHEVPGYSATPKRPSRRVRYDRAQLIPDRSSGDRFCLVEDCQLLALGMRCIRGTGFGRLLVSSTRN